MHQRMLGASWEIYILSVLLSPSHLRVFIKTQIFAPCLRCPKPQPLGERPGTCFLRRSILLIIIPIKVGKPLVSMVQSHSGGGKNEEETAGGGVKEDGDQDRQRPWGQLQQGAPMQQWYKLSFFSTYPECP